MLFKNIYKEPVPISVYPDDGKYTNEDEYLNESRYVGGAALHQEAGALSAL